VPDLLADAARGADPPLPEPVQSARQQPREPPLRVALSALPSTATSNASLPSGQ